MRGRVGFEPITRDRLLLVEGADDDRFFTALLRSNDVVAVQIVPFGGLGNLATTLVALPAADGFGALRWLGIVVDADTSATLRFQEVSRWLSVGNSRRRRSSFRVASVPWHQPTNGEGVPTTVFVLPPGATSGDLENWLLSSVPHRDQTACAEAFADCLGTAAPRPRSKLIMAAYLAANDPEKLRIGDAIQTAGVLPLVHDIYRPFLDFIPRDDEAL